MKMAVGPSNAAPEWQARSARRPNMDVKVACPLEGLVGG